MFTAGGLSVRRRHWYARKNASAAETTMLPQNVTQLTGKEAEQMVRMMDMLDNCDDVQNFYTNADIPDERV